MRCEFKDFLEIRPDEGTNIEPETQPDEYREASRRAPASIFRDRVLVPEFAIKFSSQSVARPLPFVASTNLRESCSFIQESHEPKFQHLDRTWRGAAFRCKHTAGQTRPIFRQPGAR